MDRKEEEDEEETTIVDTFVSLKTAIDIIPCSSLHPELIYVFPREEDQ